MQKNHLLPLIGRQLFFRNLNEVAPGYSENTIESRRTAGNLYSFPSGTRYFIFNQYISRKMTDNRPTWQSEIRC